MCCAKKIGTLGKCVKNYPDTRPARVTGIVKLFTNIPGVARNCMIFQELLINEQKLVGFRSVIVLFISITILKI